jgi:hypothetical protein
MSLLWAFDEAVTIGQERDFELGRRRDAIIESSHDDDLVLLDERSVGLPAASKTARRCGRIERIRTGLSLLEES